MSGSTGDFAINGRFLTQPLTGVQRYAREVVGQIDRSFAASRQRSTLLAPTMRRAPPSLAAIDIRTTRGATGHAWEQVVLPMRWNGPLLNLCNTAPIARRAQVVCIHDANVFRMPDSYGWRFRTLYRTLQPLIVRRAARVATVSRDAARQLAEHLPVALDEIAILPNGHEHARRWNPGAARVFAGVAQDRAFVLLLGSRARHKNAALVLGLADTLDALGLDLLIAGGDAEIFAAQDRAGAPNVRVLGRVTDDDLALLFARALCLAFPSFTEGFGLPVLEAMALGCPVVSTDRSSLPEICGGAALLADPGDRGAWVAHFAAVAGSPNLRAELAGRGRAQAARYSWDDTAQGYLNLLRGLS